MCNLNKKKLDILIIVGFVKKLILLLLFIQFVSCQNDVDEEIIKINLIPLFQSNMPLFNIA